MNFFVFTSRVTFFFFFFHSVNWCQHWFEFFPNPPVNILGMVENVLVHHDKRLMQHFVSCHVTSQVRPRKASRPNLPTKTDTSTISLDDGKTLGAFHSVKIPV